MKVTQSEILDVLVIEPTVYNDERGLFYESFNHFRFEQAIGRNVRFVQDNHSKSNKNVLRGLHFQNSKPQGKLIRVTQGAVFDVAVDIRRDSLTYGQWVSILLTAENKKQHWIPEGFAHGYLALSDCVELLYKTTDYYDPDCEGCILWSDPDLKIDWPLQGKPVLSLKDKQGQLFSEI